MRQIVIKRIKQAIMTARIVAHRITNSARFFLVLPLYQTIGQTKAVYGILAAKQLQPTCHDSLCQEKVLFCLLSVGE